MNLITKLSQEIITQKTLQPFSTIIVGFSGGPDSVFLLHLLHTLKEKLNLTLIAAHLDHGWRKESQEDALFCQNMADDFKITCIIAHAKDIQITRKPQGSREELGRLIRRQFFEQLLHEYHANAIALAHHFDDQLETFFLRLMRGTGLSGLAGMHVHEGLYIRPLLHTPKRDLLKYLNEHHISYRLDATNSDQSFLRNKIRHTVIPALKECDIRFETSFQRTHHHLQQAADFIEQSAQQALLDCSDATKGLSIVKVLALHPFLRYKVIETWLINHSIHFIPSAALFDEITRFLKNNKSNSHAFLENTKIVKKRGFITLEKIEL